MLMNSKKKKKKKKTKKKKKNTFLFVNKNFLNNLLFFITYRFYMLSYQMSYL